MIGYKKNKKNGKYVLTEKGPAWKIWDKDFNLLFPAPQEIYSA